MPFAKCIRSDLDVFASCASSARDVPGGRGGVTMRHMLAWGRGANAEVSHRPERALMGSNNNESESNVDAGTDKASSDDRCPAIHSEKDGSDPAESGQPPSKTDATAPAAVVTMARDARLLRSERAESGHSSTSESRASTVDNNRSRDGSSDEDEADEAPLPSVTFRKGEKSFLDFHRHYAITRHLGEGSYSTVKQVTHRAKGGAFACKIVDKLSLSPVDRQALSHEVRVLASVRHEHVMRLLEVIEDDAKCYLVTELAEGGDLFDRIVKQGRFPEPEAQRVTAALVEAVAYCHRRAIIHRDIKPENVLLSGDSVKLCDFGFAKQLASVDEQASDSCGTPGYAAPEILDGRSYGLEVDIFSLGVVAYIMLCGYPPFPMKLAQLRTHRFNVRFPSKDWAGVPPNVRDMIARMLSVDPKARPSARELRAMPWIQEGKAALERLRSEAAERQRVAELTRKQQSADRIRKKLAMGGFEVVKYGRSGLPHRTKLRLSADGKSVSWQPKLFKRGLLRYQNARGLASLFGGLGGIGGLGELGGSHPQLHPVPQVERLGDSSTTSEPCDELSSDATAATVSVRTDSNGSCSSESSTGSGSSVSDKRLWWRSLRRERGHAAERTASGGFVLPFASRSPASRSPVASSAAAAAAAASPRRLQPAPHQPLDDAIAVADVRQLLKGEAAPFFASGEPDGCKRAVDLSCALSVVARTRALHLEFANTDLRDGFAYLLEQLALPLRAPVDFHALGES